jgi:hypothetical protein
MYSSENKRAVNQYQFAIWHASRRCLCATARLRSDMGGSSKYVILALYTSITLAVFAGGYCVWTTRYGNLQKSVLFLFSNWRIILIICVMVNWNKFNCCYPKVGVPLSESRLFSFSIYIVFPCFFPRQRGLNSFHYSTESGVIKLSINSVSFNVHNSTLQNFDDAVSVTETICLY